MTLIVSSQTKKLTDGFIKFLISKIQNKVESSLDSKELSRWDNYFLNNDLGWAKYKNKITVPSTRDIILGSIYNLTYIKYPDKYIIYIDPNISINNNIKYSTLMELIDKGNLSMREYPILSRAYKYVVDKFEYLYLTYRESI